MSFFEWLATASPAVLACGGIVLAFVCVVAYVAGLTSGQHPGGKGQRARR